MIMQPRNLIFALVIIFVNAAITHAQSCGQCRNLAKSTFKANKKICKSGSTSWVDLKVCNMMEKSNMYSTMATCYQNGNPCYN